MNSNHFVDSDKKKNISQCLESLPSQHFKKREALFHQLGLIPSLIRNKKIIDFGLKKKKLFYIRNP